MSPLNQEIIQEWPKQFQIVEFFLRKDHTVSPSPSISIIHQMWSEVRTRIMI
jgi:hypothetical protein